MTIPVHYPNLNLIAQKRTGGVVNITGITYQFKYSCFKILQIINDNTSIRLEGIEDLDIIEKAIDRSCFIQLKYSRNTLTASGLNKMNTFTNFLEVYLTEPNARFKIVTNQQFTDKNLCAIQKKSFNTQELLFWEKYFKELPTSEPKTSKWNWGNFNLKDFLEKIEFEIIPEVQLDAQCKNLIIDNHNILSDNQRLFISNIFYNIHIWSINKKTITFQEIKDSIQETREDIAKGTENDAIKYQWIEPINFVNSSNFDNSDYYQGKPAKPIHITLGLPARRKRMEEEIEKSILENNITVLKASSGQGKSTLAWQVAYNLYQKGWTILELKVSEDPSKMSHLVDYLKFKIRTECTLLVLDGLSKVTQNWIELAQNLSELPVKILITTREEDWSKYGSEIYKLSLSLPEIKLDFQEAGDIYKQFNRKGVIHIGLDGSRKPFQYYWEQIANKGLLIEYVYLITQGQMLESRLREQVRNIEKEENGGVVKLETLRLVTLADVCSIKIETLKLNQFLRNENLLRQIDKRTLYQQLEKEYSICFENDYIEGLHPVRSSHLLNILNEGTPIIETVANLCQIIDSVDFFYLFSFFPTLIPLQNQEKHFDYLIPCIQDKPYKSLSNAVYGLISYEMSKYQRENQQAFDEAFRRGGGVFFNMYILPYPPREDIDIVANDNNDLKSIINLAKSIPEFDIKKSISKLFTSKLYHVFIHNEYLAHSIIGLTELLRLFQTYNLSINRFLVSSNIDLLNIFNNNEISDVAVFLELYNEINCEEYKVFVEKYGNDITSTLKEKTDTPTLYSHNDQLYSEYLLEHSNSNKANDLSSNRLKLFMKILPFYSIYNIRAETLHYPSKNMAQILIMDSTKSFEHNKITKDDYKKILNKICLDEIEQNYKTKSEYEWQKQINDLRIKCLDCVKVIVRLLEAILDNLPRHISLAREFDNLSDEIIVFNRSYKPRPTFANKFQLLKEDDDSEKDIKNIDAWRESFIVMFLRQFGHIVTIHFELFKKNVAIQKLKDTIINLPKMQKSVDVISAKSFAYFNTKDLSKNETEWYNRLEKTLLFYEEVSNGNYNRILITAKEDCSRWHYKISTSEISSIYKILNEIEQEVKIKIRYPNFIQIEEYTKKLTIGVEMFDLQNIEGEIIRIIYGLTKFIHTELHGFNIVVINIHNQATHAFYLSKSYVEKLLSLTETQVFEENDWGIDMSRVPIIINNELIAPLEGVTIGNQATLSAECGLIIENLWSFTEYRNRLSMDSTVEKKWFEEIQRIYFKQINSHFQKIHSSNISQSIKDQIQKLYEEVIEGKNYTSTQFGEFLNKIALQHIVETDPLKK